MSIRLRVDVVMPSWQRTKKEPTAEVAVGRFKSFMKDVVGIVASPPLASATVPGATLRKPEFV
jgi:hypothetical protein